jgi:hypothetical protein
VVKREWGGLHPIHCHGQTAEEGGQTQPEALGAEHGQQNEGDSANNAEGPVSFGIALLVAHRRYEDSQLQRSFIPKTHKSLPGFGFV